MKKITFLLLSFIAVVYSYGQNTCATANIISTGTTTVPALVGGEIPLPECAANAGGTRTAGVWYSFTASVDGTANITSNLPVNVAPNSDDTRVHIYSGTCLGLTCIGGNDDVDGGNFLSDASFPVTNGTTYLIAWDDRWSAAGFDFVLTETSCTATAAPGAATSPTPADTATGVALVGPGVAFSWVEDLTGDVAESFTIFIGTNPAGDDIGFLGGVTSGGVINFGATNNTTYFWRIDAINCFGTTSSAVWSFTTDSCTATAVPACTTTIAPLDGELAAATTTATDNTRQVAFEWAAIAGADSYEVILDGAVLGSTANTTVNIFGLDYNTAYTWSINPINCFGAATGCTTWTFTTEADPSLSVDQFSTNQFSVYPNPAKNSINIKSESSFDFVEIYNQLGQRVMQVNADTLVDNSINISNLNNGMYFMRIMSSNKQQTIKFIKE